MINILQIVKRYAGPYPLYDEMFRLDEKRFRLTVCYLGGEKSGKHVLEDRLHRIIFLGKKSHQLRWYNLPLLKKVGAIIDEEKIDIVSCQLHRTLPIGLGGRLFARGNPAIVSTIHGLSGRERRTRKLQNRMMHRWVDRVVAISHAVNLDILQNNPWLPAEKVVTIQNGLDFSGFDYIEHKESARRRLFPEINASFWFGTVGRLSPVKNQAALLEAFAIASKEIPGAILIIAGRGELEDTLKEQSRALGIASKTHFLGFRKDVREILPCLDCFVFPSLREGLPLSLLEAMASQLPVIATAVGGIPEVFPDRPIGRLVTDVDPASLADAMLVLARLPEAERRQYGKAARERALDRFNSARMIHDYERFYEDLHAAHTRALN